MNKSKVALITGANKGIGFETARQLGHLGITVVIGARDEQKAAAAVALLKEEGVDAAAARLDVTDHSTVDELPAFFETNFGHLDILVNNAGIVTDREIPYSRTDLDIWRQTFETNVFGLVAVTAALLPLLKNSPAGRIVNLSSNLASMTVMSDPASVASGVVAPAYIASKSAVNAITVTLAQELRHTSVKVNAAHPGWVKTAMGGDMAPMEVTDGAKTSVRLATLPDDGPTGEFFHMDAHFPW